MPAVTDPKRSQRRQIVDELLSTEKSYIDGIQIIRTVYMPEFSSFFANDETFMSSQHELFGAVEPLFRVNNTFFKKLDNAVQESSLSYAGNSLESSFGSEGELTAIWEAMHKFIDDSRVYLRFCEGSAKANETIEKLSRLSNPPAFVMSI